MIQAKIIYKICMGVAICRPKERKRNVEKIKILNIISDTNIGGAGKCIITYCKNRNAEKYDVSVLMPKNSLLKPEIEKTRSACY